MAPTVAGRSHQFGVGAVRKGIRGVRRSAFLLNEQGAVMQAWYGVRPQDTAVKAALAIP